MILPGPTTEMREQRRVNASWDELGIARLMRRSTAGATTSIYKANAIKGEPRKWRGDFRAVRCNRFALRRNTALSFSVEAERTLTGVNC
jgi:hypothetical protein